MATHFLIGLITLTAVTEYGQVKRMNQKTNRILD